MPRKDVGNFSDIWFLPLYVCMMNIHYSPYGDTILATVNINWKLKMPKFNLAKILTYTFLEIQNFYNFCRAIREKDLTEKKLSNAQRGPVPAPRGPSDKPDHIVEELKTRNYQLQEKVPHHLVWFKIMYEGIQHGLYLWHKLLWQRDLLLNKCLLIFLSTCYHWTLKDWIYWILNF